MIKKGRSTKLGDAVLNANENVESDVTHNLIRAPMNVINETVILQLECV